MASPLGTRLGPYEIAGQIGAGGMGEVYRATDVRLGREVAIKVLPATVVCDADSRQRFEREAKTFAALSHPHICHVYDVGQQDGIDFLVMEYLEGETLTTRLGKGALPLDQALQYAIQIADALDKAHRKGIVHRDLKPGNVMLTRSGVKLLDFGLAKQQPAGAVSASSVAATMASPLTGRGTILGTLHYMAPEQLRGQQADHRSDIFAFGTVLYELLCGQRAFQGEAPAQTMTAILKSHPPDLPAVERHIPPPLARIVDRCLEKTPGARFKSADDLAFALEALSAHSDAAAPAAVGGRRALLSRARLAWGVAAVLAAVVVELGIAVSMRRTTSPRPVTRLELNVPAGVELYTQSGDTVAASPDGMRIAFIGILAADRQVYVRTLDGFDAAPLRGTNDAIMCFFSADSRSIGFITADQAVRKVSLADGLVATVSPSSGLFGASWGSDDRIVFVRSETLWRVSASGGTPEQLMKLDAGRKEVLQRGRPSLPGPTRFCLPPLEAAATRASRRWCWRLGSDGCSSSAERALSTSRAGI